MYTCTLYTKGGGAGNKQRQTVNLCQNTACVNSPKWYRYIIMWACAISKCKYYMWHSNGKHVHVKRRAIYHVHVYWLCYTIMLSYSQTSLSHHVTCHMTLAVAHLVASSALSVTSAQFWASLGFSLWRLACNGSHDHHMITDIQGEPPKRYGCDLSRSHPLWLH